MALIDIIILGQLEKVSEQNYHSSINIFLNELDVFGCWSAYSMTKTIK